MLRPVIGRFSLCAVLFITLCALFSVFSITTSRPVVAAPPDTTPVALDGIQPESCSTCHKETGDKHQAAYDELYQDGIIQVTDLAYAFSAPDTSIVTFKMTKDGSPVDASKVDSLNIYFVPYTDEKFQFDPAVERLSLKGQLAV